MGCFERFLRFFFLVDFGPLLRCEVGAFFVDFVDFADFAGFALAELLLEFDVGLELFFVDFPISLVPQFLGFSDEVFLVFDGMVPRYVALRALTKTLCEYPLDSYF